MTRSDWLGIAIECFTVAASFMLAGPKGAAGVLAVGIIASVIWHRTRDRGAFSWTEIESRIKDLQQRELAHARSRNDGPISAVQAEDQNGVLRWGLMGSSKELRADAERIFSIAGSKLKSSRFAKSRQLRKEKDDLSRWLWFLVEVGDHRKDLSTTSIQGGKTVETHAYWLKRVLDDALAGCVEAMKREATRRSWLPF